MPVEGNATVNADGSVTIRWMSNLNGSGVPISTFSISGGPFETSTRTIDTTVASNLSQVTLTPDMLMFGTNYRVTIVANNLLGSSEGRDVTFRTLGRFTYRPR